MISLQTVYMPIVKTIENKSTHKRAINTQIG